MTGRGLCSLQYSPEEYCRNRKQKGSEFCYVHRNAATRNPPPEERIQAEFLRLAEENARLPHYRVTKRLQEEGARILTVGSRGYPDILFELKGRVYGIEVKGVGDRIGNRQRVVLDALRRLERVEVIRESGTKRLGELTLEEFPRSVK